MLQLSAVEVHSYFRGIFIYIRIFRLCKPHCCTLDAVFSLILLWWAKLEVPNGCNQTWCAMAPSDLCNLKLCVSHT